MTVKEIFDHPAVKAVEIEILDTIRDEERCRKGEDAKLAVQHLLSVRKRILNPSLIPDNYFQQFLGVFVGLTVCLSATAS